jgi:hypothetical protein
MNNSHRLIIVMGWVTLLVFPAIGLLVLHYVSGNWQQVFTAGWPLYYQVPLGIGLGLVTGWGLKILLGLTVLKETNLKYSQLLAQFELTRPEYIFLSVCAGVGEEILFRGCVQEYAGVWITAVGFVALHGYLNPLDWRVSIYGLTLCGLFVGVGYLKIYTGIYTCIFIHMVIDIILFNHLITAMKNKN